MNDIDRKIILTLLDKMFQHSQYFSVCDFDKLCKLAKVTPPSEIHDRLSALHCVSWADMQPCMRETVADMVLQTLNSPRMPTFDTDESGNVVALFDREIKLLRGEKL